MMKIVIGGGTGFVGRHLSALLRRKGCQVLAVSRTPGPDRITWADVKSSGLPDGTNGVVSLSGENILNPFTFNNAAFKAEVRGSRVGLTRTLAEAAAALHPKPSVFVSMSGIGYYEPSQTEQYDEDSVGGDFDFLSRLCSDWEAAAHADDQIRTVVVRSGVVLGKDGGMISQLYWPFYLGFGARISSGRQWMPWIHVDDLAAIFSFALQNDKVTGVLNGVSPTPSSNADFTRAFAAAMWRPAFLMVPAWYTKALFGPERAVVVNEGQKIIPRRTLDYGYQYRFPDLKTACKECVS